MGTPPGQPSVPVTRDEGAFLARLAVAAVRTRLAGEPRNDPTPRSGSLTTPGASFVTLERRGRLRGCVGSLGPCRPLYLDVIHNAHRAMADPRLPPVDRSDWAELDVTVSVLTSPTPIDASGLDDLLVRLRPRVDGLFVTDGERQATFLPAVWDRLAEPVDFVAALLTKGGWHVDGWPERLVAHRYQTYEFSDPAPRNPLDD